VNTHHAAVRCGVVGETLSVYALGNVTVNGLL
jgi:hypothetical protein